jgi:translation initiation factor 1
MRREKFPDVAGTQPRAAAKRPNAAISSTASGGAAGSADVTQRRTRRVRGEVASCVKDDRQVHDERVLVYSTDGSLPLPKTGPARRPQPARGAPPDDGVVRIARERRRNSAVTLVHGLAAAELDAVGKELRRLCGTGGTAKNGVVELQGDHRDRVVAYFEKIGRRAKRAGG